MHGAKRGRACDLCFSDWDAETLNSYIGTKASNVLVRTQLPDVLATEMVRLPWSTLCVFNKISGGILCVYICMVFARNLVFSCEIHTASSLPRARSVL